MKNSVETIIKHLALMPHPEGGFYKETYRSKGVVSNPYPGAEKRHFSTGIYFLLVAGNFSAFHRIRQDEMWHFYDGTTISLHIISTDGAYQLVKIGNDFASGEVPQYVVKAGNWFASEVASKDAYALAGCTVSPGFDFADFELAQADDLIQQFPQHSEIILRLTRD